jgi:quinolinate synthase
MKTVTINLEYFPGYCENAPSFVFNYKCPISGKEVIKIAARIPNENVMEALEEAYGRMREVQFSLFTEGFKTKSLIFVPDKYMAGNIAKERDMDICIFPKEGEFNENVDYEKKPTIVSWDARCYVHEQYGLGDIEAIRKNYPEAVILAHPECRPEVVSAADFSGSTSKMIDYVKKNGQDKKIALLTECSMADNLCAVFPERANNLIRMCNLRCRHMGMITLDHLLDSLLADIYQVDVSEDIRKKAEVAVKRMLEIS